MKFNDEAIILSKRKVGENKLLLSIFTKENGKQQAYANISKRTSALYEVGNLINVNFRSKENAKSGNITAEIIKPYGLSVLDDFAKLNVIMLVNSLVDHILKPGEVSLPIFLALIRLSETIQVEKNWLKHYLNFELFLLANSGFGLDVSKCSVTESKQNLAYISPKTGAAVSYEIGKDYEYRLFKMPKFFSQDFDSTDMIYTLTITEYFLNKHFYTNSNKVLAIHKEQLIKFAGNFISA